MVDRVRCAYLIQSHTQPRQLARLVDALRRGSDATILVVHDASREPLDESLLAGYGVLVLQRRTPVRRGRLSCIEPYLDGARHLLATGVAFDWLVFVSGQDYPVRPPAAIEAGLAASGADGLIAHWDVLGPASPWPLRRARRRYFYRYAALPDVLAPWLRLVRPLEAVTPLHLFLTYGALFGWPARRTPFQDDFRCWGGWMWHSLTRGCVEYLLRYLDEHPELVAYYRRTVVPDESLVQTVLVNAGRFRLVNDNRRYADTCERPLGHARELDLGDLAEITSGRYDFARRVDLVASAALLDELDARCRSKPR